jgi:hypothetical protein
MAGEVFLHAEETVALFRRGLARHAKIACGLGRLLEVPFLFVLF